MHSQRRRGETRLCKERQKEMETEIQKQKKGVRVEGRDGKRQHQE